ncbi:ribonuclease HI [Inhella gelatinilytica]|uniref:Ribonuclease H n=1 Tax=Inhella gelatinilytica TaxID=2795030 RepID=A0A931ND03_9BURK|nr:ribonuclease HI [Inhella gelatinilytica]MBH9552572.1 ribonuclease HI [Inhella gelatinilytica]
MNATVAIKKPEVTLYTDGACKGNPGPGGWGVWMIAGGHQKEMFGGSPSTTNNQMEMTAVIEALAALKRSCKIQLYTDSEYVLKGMTEWLPGWVRRGWKTAAGAPVKNQELWLRLAGLAALHEIKWHWVKGHAGHEGNERADELANRGVELALKGGK